MPTRWPLVELAGPSQPCQGRSLGQVHLTESPLWLRDALSKPSWLLPYLGAFV